jgi:hypothetical protein
VIATKSRSSNVPTAGSPLAESADGAAVAPRALSMQSTLRNVRDAARQVIANMTMSPQERAQRLLREVLKEETGLTEDGRETLRKVLRIVLMPAAELSQPSFVSQSGMDGDTKSFLMGQMAAAPKIAQALKSLARERGRYRAMSLSGKSLSVSETLELVMAASGQDDAALLGGAAADSAASLSSTSSSSAFSSATSTATASSLAAAAGTPSPATPKSTASTEECLRIALGKVHAIDFDVFDFAATACKGRPLQTLGLSLLSTMGLCEALKIDRVSLAAFLADVERKYHANPYHNSTHAADVLQTTHHILVTSGIGDSLAPLDMFATFIAAIVHDVDHPGRNNAYAIATESEHALAHNDRSVLENHSLVVGFRLLRKHRVLAPLPDADRRAFRKTVIDLVLATDIGSHFSIVGELRAALDACDPPDTFAENHRTLALQAVLKMADISNPGKPRALYMGWVDRVMGEFFAQGDDERARGLPVSMFMDRAVTSVPKCQVGFITYIVKPLYSLVARFGNIDGYLENLESNLKYFEMEILKEGGGDQ